MILIALRSIFLLTLLTGIAVAGQGPASDRADRGAPETTQAKPVVAVAARVAEVGGITRLVFDLDAPVAVSTTFSTDPDRLVVELPDVNFQLDPAAGRLEGRPVGLVRGFRFGTVARGHSKIVVDLRAPATLREASVASIAGGAPSRLTIELAPTDAKGFQAAVQAGATPMPDVAAAAPPPGDARPVIVIDPGHGGADPGAGGATGVLEKDVVLAFAKTLDGQLAASGRYRVVLTRTGDSFVSLGDRVRIAREAGAALMISVHADMLSDPSVSGATVYTASDQASDAEAGRLAAAENRADEVAGVTAAAPVAPEVSGILLDLTRRETRTYAHQFQRNLTGYWAKFARLNRNPERSAGFRVLQAADVPSVLLELGYLSSERDRASLTSDAWREKAAGSVAAAVDGFFGSRAAAPQTAAGAEAGIVR